MRIIFKFLFIALPLALAACANEGEFTPPEFHAQPVAITKLSEQVKLYKPRKVVATIRFSRESLSITTLGWCEDAEVFQKGVAICKSVAEYVVLKNKNKSSVWFRQTRDASSQGSPNNSDLKLLPRLDYSKFNKISDAAEVQNIEVDIDIETYKEYLTSIHKKRTSQCKASELHSIAENDTPETAGNDMFYIKDLFYFDWFFNDDVSLIEFNIFKNKMVGFGSAFNLIKESLDKTNYTNIIGTKADYISGTNPRHFGVDYFFERACNSKRKEILFRKPELKPEQLDQLASDALDKQKASYLEDFAFTKNRAVVGEINKYSFDELNEKPEIVSW